MQPLIMNCLKHVERNAVMEIKQRCVFMLCSLYSIWKSSWYCMSQTVQCVSLQGPVSEGCRWPCCVVCGANGAIDGETVRERERERDSETEKKWDSDTVCVWVRERETVRRRKSETDGEWDREKVRRWYRHRDSERVRQRDRQWECVTCTDTSFEAPLHHLGVKDEAKVVSVHAMKACMGSRGVAPLMLKLCAKWRWIFGFTPLPLYSLGSLNNRHGWHQGRSGSFGEDRKLCSC
jgi:hypothetical protein